MLTTSESPSAIVRRVALQEGVDPNVLLSIWQQESSGRTDPTFKHPAIQSGPRAGEYARGPFGIMSFHGEIPNDFEGQARWAAKHLKERGVRGYYGTGKAPAWFPTTDEYEAQVMRRAGQPLQVAQAGRADVSPGLLQIDLSRPMINNPDGSFSTERTITIEMDGKHLLIPTIVGGRQLTADQAVEALKRGQNQPVGIFDTAEEAASAAVARSRRIGELRRPQPITPQEVPMYEEEIPQPTGIEALMQSPLFLMGSSLLAGAGGQAGPVGQGLMRGIGAYQAQQSNNSLQDWRRSQMAEQRRKEALQRQAQMQMEQVIATLPPEVQAIARANPEIVSKLAERSLGLNQPWYITPEGIDPRAIEYQRAGAPSTTINMPPNIKEGYEYTQTPEGKITAAPVPGGPADPKTPKAPTEGQRKAGGWYSRMSAVEPEIETLEGALGKDGPSAWDYYTAQQPITNALASDPYKKYLQKSRDWISGILRYESGAAVPETEFWRYYQTFFAVPGDSASVIEEKRKARKRAAEGLREGAGSAVRDEGVPPPPPGFTEPVR